MSLLHLAASLGYTKLACSLLHLVSESTSETLKSEIDPMSQDEEGFTPLMRACFNGHYETAIFFYRWNSAAFKVRNYDGESCLDLAAPYEELCAELARLERIRKMGELASRAAKASKKVSMTSAAAASEFLKPATAFRKPPHRAASLDSENEAAQQQHQLLHQQQQQQRQHHRNMRRSASPCLRQPLSVDVSQQTSRRERRIHHGLSKRSSFDSGINLYQLNMSGEYREKKDAKTMPK